MTMSSRSLGRWVVAAVCAVLAGTGGGTVPAWGVVTTFSDRAAFEAGLSVAGRVDFEGLAPAGSYIGPLGNNTTWDPGPWTISSVTFSTTKLLWVVDPAYLPLYYDWGSGANIQATSTYYPNGGGPLRATLPAPDYAVGFDYFTIEANLNVVVRLSTGEVYPLASNPKPTMSFIGFRSDTPIAWVEIDGVQGVDYTQMDNFVYGRLGGVAIPEPLSAGLAGIAVLAVACSIRRRRA